MLDEKNPQKSPCIRCNTCDGFPCLVNAKADAHICCVVPRSTPECHAADRHQSDAARDERFRPRSHGRGSRAQRREGDLFRQNRRLSPAAQSIRPRCCSARRMTNIRDGLANGSDVVGRHYMGHVNSVLMALSKCPNPTVFQKTLSVNDFYFARPNGNFRWATSRLSENSTATRSRPARRKSRRNGRSISWANTHSISGSPPKTCPTRTTASRSTARAKSSLQYKPNNEEGHKRLIKKLERLMNQQRACPMHGHECHEGFSRAISISASASRWRGSRIRTARFVSATIRRRARSIATARPTRSTISMWLTRASSARAAR